MTMKRIQHRAVILPFIDAPLTEAVRAGQNEVCLSVHADAALLLIGQLLHSARPHKQRTGFHYFRKRTSKKKKSYFGIKTSDESR